MSDSGELETRPQAITPEKETPVTETPAEKPENEAEKKPVRERKKKATVVKKPKAPSHPPYFQMIKEAITALNEKGGSSPYAIAKYMEENHKPVLPVNFRKILGLQLKNSVAKGKLIKIKASYKLFEAGKREKSAVTTRAATTRAARANAAKPKEGKKKRRQKSKSVSMIENPHATSVVAAAAMVTTRARRSKRSAPPAKPKQLKSIKMKK